MTDEIRSEVRDRTLWITFDRPQARNAMTFAMYERLAELCASVPTDRSVTAVVISGAGGKAFAAGTDMTQFRAFQTAQDALDYEAEINRVLEAVDTCPLPTIAAIHGACTGGGASIAAACDIRIATARMKFGFPIARTLGNCLNAANLARLMEAEEALATGLVSEVLPDEDALLARAAELAAQLGRMAPLTLRATKEAMRRNRAALAVKDADLITMCYMSRDFKKGLEAFLAKRTPDWTGT